MSDTLYEKLEHHRQISAQLKDLKIEEAALRQDICDEILEGMDVGTHNLTVNDLKVKAVKKVSHKIDKDLLEENIDLMTPEESECVRYKPELNLTKYKKLDDAESSGMLDECITVSPSMPSLEVQLNNV